MTTFEVLVMKDSKRTTMLLKEIYPDICSNIKKQKF